MGVLCLEGLLPGRAETPRRLVEKGDLGAGNIGFLGEKNGGDLQVIKRSDAEGAVDHATFYLKRPTPIIITYISKNKI